MPSPFPGMDPYLESQWSAVHIFMLTALTTALKRTLPSGLVARPEESVRIETVAGDRLYSYRPDVSVKDVSRGGLAAVAIAAPTVVTVTPGIELDLHREPVVTRNIRIVDRRNADRIVTVIDVLSPGNKEAGQLNDTYRAKLSDYEEAGANWVEIDLLRSSRRLLPIRPEQLPSGTARDYLALSYRAVTGRVTAYPIGLREPLPTLAVPLRPNDADAPLDLQAVFNRVYDDGPFAEDTDYARPPDPPLSDADAAWAMGLLRRRR